jgi:hypothetical protein
MLRQQPARHRAERGGAGEDGGDPGLEAPAFPRRHDLRDQRDGQRDQPAAAEALQQPAGRERAEAGR